MRLKLILGTLSAISLGLPSLAGAGRRLFVQRVVILRLLLLRALAINSELIWVAAP